MVPPLEKALLNLSTDAWTAWILSSDALLALSSSMMNLSSAFSPETPFSPSVVLV